MLNDFRERGREKKERESRKREKERETLIGCLSHVPSPGTKPTT